MATSLHIKTRRLTVCSKAFPRKRNNYSFLPQLQLQGRWLADTGFECGQVVTVKHKRNMIIITHQNAANKKF